MSKENMAKLSQIKIKFIEQIVAERSLDTLSAWFDMYEEAKYVASLTSNEEELKEFRVNFKDSIKKGFLASRNKINNVEP